MTQENEAGMDFAKALILDELFDLSLYRALRDRFSGKLRAILDELITVETKHYAFWQDFFGLRLEKLDIGRKIKLRLLAWIGALFGETGVYLILEAIEVYGIRKYLTLWKLYRNTPLAEAVRTVLEDEFEHEDQVVSGLEERKISPERIRNLFLGFNDGLVEFLGAVGGFSAAFQDSRSVLIASLTGAAAGALSMAVGVFASSSSEQEMQRMADAKREFLSGPGRRGGESTQPLVSAVIVGFSYAFGAMIPVAPLLFGSTNAWVSWVCGGTMLVFVTAALAFLSGMRIRKRVFLNFLMVSAAVAVAYGVGILAQKISSLI